MPSEDERGIMINLSYAVTLPDCQAKKMQCFRMNIEDVSLPASLVAAEPYLWHVHFADSNRWYPGAGHINFREILEALKLIGYDRFITMEMEQHPDSPTAARRAIRTVRALLDTL